MVKVAFATACLVKAHQRPHVRLCHWASESPARKTGQDLFRTGMLVSRALRVTSEDERPAWCLPATRRFIGSSNRDTGDVGKVALDDLKSLLSGAVEAQLHIHRRPFRRRSGLRGSPAAGWR